MDEVLYEKKGRIAYIQLNRPDRLNAVTNAGVDELERLWIDFREDDGLWVAVLSGAGKSFCAGADIRALGSSRPPGESVARPTPTGCKVYKPTVAALQGHVLGIGLMLALSCDIRIAAEDVQLGAPEPKWGIASTFAPYLFRHMFPGLAYEILLTGDSIGAQRAHQYGLVNKVVSRERLTDEATAMAERICQNSPVALRTEKEAAELTKGLDWDRMWGLVARLYQRARDSEDRAEGIKAFKEKRKPIWKGK